MSNSYDFVVKFDELDNFLSQNHVHDPPLNPQFPVPNPRFPVPNLQSPIP